jgi:hypothetical protein
MVPPALVATATLQADVFSKVDPPRRHRSPVAATCRTLAAWTMTSTTATSTSAEAIHGDGPGPAENRKRPFFFKHNKLANSSPLHPRCTAPFSTQATRQASHAISLLLSSKRPRWDSNPRWPKPTDLQSAPLVHSGTRPEFTESAILRYWRVLASIAAADASPRPHWRCRAACGPAPGRRWRTCVCVGAPASGPDPDIALGVCPAMLILERVSPPGVITSCPGKRIAAHADSGTADPEVGSAAQQAAG